MNKDGFKSTNLKKNFSSAGANVKTSRLNAGGDKNYKGKRS